MALLVCMLGFSCKSKIITVEKIVQAPPPPPVVQYIHDTLVIEHMVDVRGEPFDNNDELWSSLINSSPSLKNGWTSFVLYDMQADQMIYNRHGQKFNTPASNVKLLTMYAAMKILGDSIPALKYIETDTSLVFWGTGDPTLLNRHFTSPRVIEFLRSKGSTKSLYYYAKGIDAHYGAGWMWDDYDGNYQPEICPMPMYENMVMCTFEQGKGLSFTPSHYNYNLIVDKDYNINRDLDSNYFNVSTAILSLSDFEQQIPICRMADQVVPLLERVIWHKIRKTWNYPDKNKAQTFYSMPKDAVINRMMVESDNFIAEHLLLTCGSVLNDSLSTEYTIESLLKREMAHLFPKPKWVDGSGLSRYNLSTADMNVQLLNDMYKQYGEAKVFSLLGVGGKEGTLKHYFNDRGTPYIYAKTGTLSSVFCLSGYIIANSGRRLAFSMMNNHYNTSSTKARQDVQRLLKQVYLRY